MTTYEHVVEHARAYEETGQLRVGIDTWAILSPGSKPERVPVERFPWEEVIAVEVGSSFIGGMTDSAKFVASVTGSDCVHAYWILDIIERPDDRRDGVWQVPVGLAEQFPRIQSTTARAQLVEVLSRLVSALRGQASEAAIRSASLDRSAINVAKVMVQVNGKK